MPGGIQLLSFLVAEIRMDDLANAAPMLGALLWTIGAWFYARRLHRKLIKSEAARRSRPAE